MIRRAYLALVLALAVVLGTVPGNAGPGSTHWSQWARRTPWTPKETGSALKLWLTADTGITQAGGVVSQWDDQSGNGNNFTASSTAQPAFSSSDAAFGSRPVLTWDGSNDVMTGPALSAFVANNAYTVFAVVNVTTIHTSTVNFELNDAIVGESGGLFALYLRSTPTIGIYNWDGNRDTAATSISTATTFIVTARHASGSLGIRINEGSETTAASGNTTGLTGTVTLGKSSSTQFYGGKISEVIILNSWPGEVVAHTCRQYLSDKYRVTL